MHNTNLSANIAGSGCRLDLVHHNLLWTKLTENIKMKFARPYNTYSTPLVYESQGRITEKDDKVQTQVLRSIPGPHWT